MMNYDEMYRIARDRQQERLLEAMRDKELRALHTGSGPGLVQRLAKLAGALMSILA